KIRKRQWVFTAIYVLWALSAIAFLRMASAPATPKQISYSDFLMQLRGGNVASVRITDRQVIATMKPPTPTPATKTPAKKGPAPPPAPREIVATRIPGLDAGPLVQELRQRGIKFSGTIEQPSWWTDILISWGPMLLIFAIYGFAMWRMRKGGGAALNF